MGSGGLESGGLESENLGLGSAQLWLGGRVRKVGVRGVESASGVRGVKGQKSWDRGGWH